MAVVEGQVIRVGVGVVEDRAHEGGARARVGRELVGQDDNAARIGEERRGFI